MQRGMVTLLLILLLVPTVAAFSIKPVSGGDLFGGLHLSARVRGLCVFNTSLIIVVLAVIGFTVYQMGTGIFFRILGTALIMATVQLFCQNQTVTFVVVALLVVKPLIFKS